MHLFVLAWDVDRPGHPDPAVLALARALGDLGVDCEVLTLGAGPTSTRRLDGVDVTWVAEAPPVLPSPPAYDLSRVLAAASRVSAVAERRCQQRSPSAVLAVGWQAAWTATTLRASRQLPIVAMLDSIAPGRADGELDDAGRLVAQVEWWLTYEARRVVVPTPRLRKDLGRAYRLPPAKVDVVAPGADLVPPVEGLGTAVVGDGAVARAVRGALGARPVGRAGIVVVLDDAAVREVVDAMAAGAVVVVPDDGPLRELVHAGRTGIRVPRERDAVVAAVRALQTAPGRRQRLGDRARERVATTHRWEDVASRVVDVVRRAEAEEHELTAGAAEERPLRSILLRSPFLRPVADGGATRPNAGHDAGGHG